MRTAAWLGLAAGAAGLAALSERRYAARVASDPCAPDLERVEPARELVVAADGADLHVEVHGPEGAPTAVLVHGWTCTSGFWARQVRALSDELRLVTYDLRGHGRSTGAPESFTTDALGDDLQAVLEATVPAGRRALLVGHSMGAMSIAAWAGRHDARARATAALLLSTGVARLSMDASFVPLPDRWAVHRGLLQAAVLGSAAPLVGPRSLHALGARRLAHAPTASPAIVDLAVRDQRAIAPRARAAWAVVMGDLDLRHEVRSLDVPTTVVVGSLDRLTPPVYAERLAALLPQLTDLVTLDGVGHMTPLEAPDAVAALIRTTVAERVAA